MLVHRQRRSTAGTIREYFNHLVKTTMLSHDGRTSDKENSNAVKTAPHVSGDTQTRGTFRDAPAPLPSLPPCSSMPPQATPLPKHNPTHQLFACQCLSRPRDESLRNSGGGRSQHRRHSRGRGGAQGHARGHGNAREGRYQPGDRGHGGQHRARRQNSSDDGAAIAQPLARVRVIRRRDGGLPQAFRETLAPSLQARGVGAGLQGLPQGVPDDGHAVAEDGVIHAGAR